MKSIRLLDEESINIMEDGAPRKLMRSDSTQAKFTSLLKRFNDLYSEIAALGKSPEERIEERRKLRQENKPQSSES